MMLIRRLASGFPLACSLHPRTWIALTLLLQPAALAAQTLSGTLTDSLSGRPLVGVRLTLLNLDGDEVITVQSDERGRFELVAPEAARYRLALTAPGYQPRRSDPFDLLPAQTQDVNITMLELPRELAPIEGRAAAPTRRPLDDFWERREKGVGSFITRAEFMEQGSPKEPTDVLRRMSGIRLYPASGEVGGMRYLVRTTRGRSRGGFGSPIGCPPIYFVDGHYRGDAGSVDIDAALLLEHVEAVEVYGSAVTVPTEFNRPGATCGVIVFWTR